MALMLSGCQSVPERQYDPRGKWLSDYADGQVIEAKSGKITYTQAVANTRKQRDVIYNSAPIHPVDEAYFAYLGQVAAQLDAKTLTLEQAIPLVEAKKKDVDAYFAEAVRQEHNNRARASASNLFEGLFAVGAVTLGAMAVAEQSQPAYAPPAPPQIINIEVHEKPQPPRFPRPY